MLLYLFTGVFTLIEIVTPHEKNDTHGTIDSQFSRIFEFFKKLKTKFIFFLLFSSAGYLQYRPISYTKPIRDITSKTDVHLNKPNFVEDAKNYLNLSVAYSYYGNALNENLVQSFNLSFGMPQDKFYSNYTTW